MGLTHGGMGVLVSIRVGHNLQEDVHVVEDGSDSGVSSIVSHNLMTKKKHVIAQKLHMHRRIKRQLCHDNQSTFLANQVPLA